MDVKFPENRHAWFLQLRVPWLAHDAHIDYDEELYPIIYDAEAKEQDFQPLKLTREKFFIVLFETSALKRRILRQRRPAVALTATISVSSLSALRRRQHLPASIARISFAERVQSGDDGNDEATMSESIAAIWFEEFHKHVLVNPFWILRIVKKLGNIFAATTSTPKKI